jgi:hypothetical protein
MGRCTGTRMHAAMDTRFFSGRSVLNSYVPQKFLSFSISFMVSTHHTPLKSLREKKSIKKPET